MLAALVLVLTVSAVGREPIRKGWFIFYLDDPSAHPRVEKSLFDARARLQNLLADSLEFGTSVYLVNSNIRFEELIGGQFPEWGAA
ncbi:hypothetical protein GF377_06800, partial [candidate division GN15 bacterium]|nr:hypothetical protein [candidate division GN15 bacterium]